MNKVQAALIGILAVSISGCAAHGPQIGNSYESLDKNYAPQMAYLATEVSQELALQYPGKLIYVDATHKEGSFAYHLRKALASRNALAITPPMADVSLRYAMEEFASDMGYLNMRFNDGQIKSKTFYLIPKTTYQLAAPVPEITEAPKPVSFDTTSVKETPISANPIVETEEVKPEAPVIAAALKDVAPKTPAQELQKISSHTVREGDSAASIARQYGIPFKTFCNANGGIEKCELIKPGQVLNFPYPISVPSSKPVESASTGHSAPVPVMQPASNLSSLPEEKGIVPAWRLSPGSLRNQLQSWSAKAGYQLVWKTDLDLDMNASATFYGDITEALSQLFDGLHNTGHALTVTIYKGNHVIEVGDK